MTYYVSNKKTGEITNHVEIYHPEEFDILDVYGDEYEIITEPELYQIELYEMRMNRRMKKLGIEE